MTIPGQPTKLQNYAEYDSLQHLADEAKRGRTDSSYDRDIQWSGGTFAEAFDYAHNGWEAVAPDVDTTLTDTAEVQSFAPYIEVAGDEVHMDNYLAGLPENMISYPLQAKEVRSVTVLTPITWSSIVKADAAKMRALAVAGALESFRKRGIMVNVVGYLSVTGKDKCAVNLVKIADTRFAFDMTRVIFGCGHPTMLRQLFFGIEDGWSQEDRNTFGVPGSRGYPCSITQMGSEIESFVFNQLPTEVTIELPLLSGSHNRWSQEQHNKEVAQLMGAHS